MDRCSNHPPAWGTTQEEEDISSEESTEELPQKTEVEEDLSSEESEEEFNDVVVVEAYTNEPEPFKSRCGRRNSFGLGVRIQNYQDDEAQFGEWPHMCAILRREVISGGGDGYSQQQDAEEEVMVFQAGASLIASGVVLTGAHKVQDFV